MCGITGFIDFSGHSNLTNLQKQIVSINHRGPDAQGHHFVTTPNYSLGLGHTRLSILDLSALGHQPMHFEHLSMVYNGEVYNYIAIRKELIGLGYTFNSHSDTEVILKSYHAWGLAMVHRLNGMFALAIFDQKNQTITLLRDRAGVKPLYYSYINNLFLFGSELKCLYAHPQYEKKLEMSALSGYLQYGYIHEPDTIFEKTHKLAPGHSLTLHLPTKKLSLKQYWSIFEQYAQPISLLSLSETIQQLHHLLADACNLRMIADVPLGVFLSGGYDSTLVTALIQQQRTEAIRTFTIGFGNTAYDESAHAAQVAKHLGTNHTTYQCTEQDALAMIPLLPEHFDEPFADSSAIPTMLVSKITRQAVTVALSADGGDELFVGYEKYRSSQKYWKIYQKYPFLKSMFRKALPALSDTLQKSGLLKDKYLFLYQNFEKIAFANHAVAALDAYQKVFTQQELMMLNKNLAPLSPNKTDSLYTRNISPSRSKLLAFDYSTYQADDILTKVDRASMAFSLEAREPLLDYRLAAFVAQIPDAYKTHKGIDKYLIKKIVHNYVPEKLMNRPKMGFSVPMTKWLQGTLKPLVLDCLSKERIQKQAILDNQNVQRLVQQFYKNGDFNLATKIWYLVAFQLWHRRWME